MADHHPELEPRLSSGPRPWVDTFEPTADGQLGNYSRIRLPEDRPSREEIVPPTDAEVATSRARLAGAPSPLGRHHRPDQGEPMTDRNLHPITEECPERRGGATHTVLGRELREGDLLFFLSSPHLVTGFEDYAGKLLDDGTLPPGTRIARSGGPRWAGDKGWGMTIDPSARYYIA
jgi:hypothetical protein